MFDLYLRVFVNVTFQYLIELKKMLLKRIFFIFSKIRTLYIWKNKNELIITSVLKKRLWRNRYLVQSPQNKYQISWYWTIFFSINTFESSKLVWVSLHQLNIERRCVLSQGFETYKTRPSGWDWMGTTF